MITIHRKILLGFGLLCFLQCCLAAEDNSTDSDNLLAGLDYSVLRMHRNATNNAESFHLCLIDFIVDGISKKFNYETLPIRQLTKAVDLCNKNERSIFENGYFVQELSNRCEVQIQVQNFAHQYPNSIGLIFVTSCDMNLRSLNLTQSLLEKQSFVVSVINKDKIDRLIEFNNAQRIKVDNSIGSRNSFISMLMIFFMAVLCIFVGALWGGRTRSKSFTEYKEKISTRTNSDQNGENGAQSDQSLNNDKDTNSASEFNTSNIFCAVTFTICVILTLYFFYRYIVYFFIIIFMLFSAISFFECTSSITKLFCSSALLAHHFSINFKFIGLIKMKVANIPLLIISFTLPIVWFCIRHSSSKAWILQDLLCVCFSIFQLRILRLSSFKTCFMLLFSLFIYDIFFVFITPYFTKNGVSIMEYVATGGASRRGTLFDSRCIGGKVEILPLLIRVPRNLWTADPANPHDFCIPGAYSLLGLGDIIIPGILVSYCASFDYIFNNPRLPYFWTAVISYIFGLGFSYIALVTMQIAQPALLYLVPSTIFSVLLLSLIRGELRFLWNGPEKSFLSLHPHFKCADVESRSKFDEQE